MSYNLEVVEKAKKMRGKGYSLDEIALEFKISKSTASMWTSKVKITSRGKRRIIARQIRARQKGLLIIKKRRIAVRKAIEKSARSALKNIKIDDDLSKLLCSVFIWTEGEKGNYDRVGFANSDPRMVNTFLSLLRRSFKLDERKLRALVHIHEYHNKDEIISFWSKVTKIPSSQFTKCYLKPHTGKRKRDDYMGSMHISYCDYKVARELASVYNMFAARFRSVGQW